MQKMLGLFASFVLFAAVPTSTNYTLKTYDIGTGGTTSGSTNYGLQAGTGSQSGTAQSSAAYTVQSDGRGVTDAAVPPAPALTNPSNYYDRLKLVLAIGGNPNDTKYLIAVSTDNFATTKYVQTDNSLGSSQAIANYQTYSAWGGSSGFLITGLSASTAYQVRVKALQGAYTGSSFGPVATASTVAPSVSFSLSTTLTSTPPFTVGFSNITAGVVATGNADATMGLTTNANNGGSIYVKDSNAGLYSALANTTITSASTDLSSSSLGYGGQVTTTSQTSGGPINSQSPFNGISNNIGAFSATLQQLVSTSAPVTNGNATLRLKAKAAATTPSAVDYTDTITLIATMSF